MQEIGASEIGAQRLSLPPCRFVAAGFKEMCDPVLTSKKTSIANAAISTMQINVDIVDFNYKMHQ